MNTSILKLTARSYAGKQPASYPQSRCYHVNVNEYSVKNLEYYGISSTFLQLPMDTQKFSAVRALVHYNHTTRWFNHKGQSHAWFVLFYDFSKLDVVHLGRESGFGDDSAWRSCDVRFSRKFNLHKTLSISHRQWWNSRVKSVWSCLSSDSQTSHSSVRICGMHKIGRL